ncbi:MAG: Tn3 family transposase [Cyanobacteria bacterium J06649_12]
MQSMASTPLLYERKRIKYNHLVANCVIFHNVVELTRVLNQIYAEGHRFEPEAIAALISGRLIVRYAS